MRATRRQRIELLFVTLEKSSGFHETINFQDCAISPNRFHWQTQNSASPETPIGKQYLASPGNEWTFQLFVRTHPDSAFVACGPVRLLECSGASPMNSIWQLDTPLPARLFREFSVLRGG